MKFIRDGDAEGLVGINDLNTLNTFIKNYNKCDPEIFMITRKPNQLGSRMVVSLSRGIAYETEDFESFALQRIDLDPAIWRPRK